MPILAQSDACIMSICFTLGWPLEEKLRMRQIGTHGKINNCSFKVNYMMETNVTYFKARLKLETLFLIRFLTSLLVPLMASQYKAFKFSCTLLSPFMAS